jgi:hypothetical protein
VDPVPDTLLSFSGRAGNRTLASGSVAKNPGHWTTEAVLYPQKLALISPTSGGRSVGIVRSRTKATELLLLLLVINNNNNNNKSSDWSAVESVSLNKLTQEAFT